MNTKEKLSMTFKLLREYRKTIIDHPEVINDDDRYMLDNIQVLVESIQNQVN